jgi:hypothetical protein
MPKQNYRQAKRHREETRKKRQLEKQQRKLNRSGEPASAADVAVAPATEPTESA